MRLLRTIAWPLLLATVSVAERADSTIASERSMPPAFKLLSERSIFLRGLPPMAINTVRPRDPEQVLVFNGAAQTDGNIEGFLQDTEAGTEQIVHVGDRVAFGKIAKITLNELDYARSSANVTVHVAIGNNLNGYNFSEATTMPENGGVDSDVLAHMRARRLKELRAGG